MYLKSLRIEAAGREIRTVPFRRGLNLIVDVTPSGKRTATGNNVGKTTALRCVDYCLEASEDSLYFDREWETPNETVLKFLAEQRPTFTLNFEGPDGRIHTVSRTFRNNKERVLDGELVSRKECEKALRTLLFRVEGNKPTLRQLLGKFVRLSMEAKNRTMRWLPFGGEADYDILWLSLFGASMGSLLNKRRELQKQLASLKNQKSEVEKVARSPRQERKVIEHRLALAKKELQALSLEGAQERDMHRLSALRERIALESQRVVEAEAHVVNCERTLDHLAASVPKVGAATIREIYTDAERLVEDLHTTYEQLVTFHNAMLKNKATFTQRTRARWLDELTRQRAYLRASLEEESQLLQTFSSPDIWGDVRRLNDEIFRLSEQRGYLEGLENKLKDLKAEIATTQAGIADADHVIESEGESIQMHLEDFNQFFAEFSKRLVDISCYLDLRLVEKKGGQYKVAASISNTEGNEGSGEKKTQIAAFDLAYLRWQQERKAKTIRFTLHDEVELIHGNQLATLFEIANDLDGQFVVPILTDRLSAVPFAGIDACKILELSRDERFFGIP